MDNLIAHPLVIGSGSIEIMHHRVGFIPFSIASLKLYDAHRLYYPHVQMLKKKKGVVK